MGLCKRPINQIEGGGNGESDRLIFLVERRRRRSAKMEVQIR